MPEHSQPETAMPTFTDVYQQHAQDPQANPDLLAHMQRLSEVEQQSEQALVADVVQHETGSVRAEITPEHHQEHVDMARAAGVADIDERSANEQNLIGEVLEIGDTAMQETSEAPLQSAEVSVPVRMTLNILNHSINQLPTIESRENFDIMRKELTEVLSSISYEQMTLAGNFDLVEACLRMDAAIEAHRNPDIQSEVGMTLGMLDKMKPFTFQLSAFYSNNYLGPRIRDRLTTTPLTTSNAMDMGYIMEAVYGFRQQNADTDDAYQKELTAQQNDLVLNYLESSDYAGSASLGTLEYRYFEVNKNNEQAVNNFEADASAAIRDVLRNEFKLNPSMVRDMGRAMSSRLHRGPEEDESHYNMYSVIKSFKRMGEVIEAVPAETIQHLHDELGVLNLDMYRPDDLLGMAALLEGDPTYIDHLKAGDTTVVFADALGDHNGALTDAFQNYSNGSNRTLMFEVSKPSDFYRCMIMLKRTGVKPSTLVVAAHGSPGVTGFGRPENSFSLEANRFAPEAYGEHERPFFLEESALGRLASDEFMQSSRGIDDPDERVGRRSIIFNSCSSDVIWDDALSSTVESVVRTINRYDVDAYGASSVLYVDKAAAGLRFSGPGEVSSDGVPAAEVPNGSKVSLIEPEPVKRSLLERLKSRHSKKSEENRRLAIKRSEFETIVIRKQAEKEQVA